MTKTLVNWASWHCKQSRGLGWRGVGGARCKLHANDNWLSVVLAGSRARAYGLRSVTGSVYANIWRIQVGSQANKYPVKNALERCKRFTTGQEAYITTAESIIHPHTAAKRRRRGEIETSNQRTRGEVDITVQPLHMNQSSTQLHVIQPTPASSGATLP